jgi:hypothetical protein
MIKYNGTNHFEPVFPINNFRDWSPQPTAAIQEEGFEENSVGTVQGSNYESDSIQDGIEASDGSASHKSVGEDKNTLDDLLVMPPPEAPSAQTSTQYYETFLDTVIQTGTRRDVAELKDPPETLNESRMPSTPKVLHANPFTSPMRDVISHSKPKEIDEYFIIEQEIDGVLCATCIQWRHVL